MKKTLKSISALALVAILFTAAYASVSYDPMTGGFVGKGDVQTLLGLNNKGMQDLVKANGVVFTYESSVRYAGVCTWVTGEGTRGEKTHNVDVNKSFSVTSTIAFENKKTGQYTGWFLAPAVLTGQSGTVPVVGDPCHGNEGHDGTFSSVVLDEASSEGGLKVNGLSLPNTPVIVVP